MTIKQNQNTQPAEIPIWEYPTQELKDRIGNFEQEYKAHLTGEKVHNAILGPTKQGIVDWAIEFGAIIKKEDFRGCYEDWRVVLPGYYDWAKKRSALSELQSRREYAERKESEAHIAVENQEEQLQNEIRADIFAWPKDDIKPEDIPF